MNRRDILQGLSLSMLSRKLLSNEPLLAQTAKTKPKPIAANDRINVGVIGPGSRGREVMRQMLRIPGVEMAAVCDVYEPRFAEVNELVGKKVMSYKDYRELLERKDLDVILIATPPIFHSEYTIAALEKGKPVYGEKTLGFTVQDCNDVVAAVKRTGQIFQIGHQLRYASWIQQSIKRVRQGDIGVPTHVYAYWHRADDWRRPVNDPKLEHLFNWRLYNETSGGLLEELGSHAIDIANWVFGETPETIMGSTSIAVYHDGRTVGDNVQAVIGYSKGRRMFFSSITDNAMMADQIWIYGTEGSAQITLQDATFYRPTQKTVTASSHTDIVERGVKTGASYKTSWEMPYRGPGERVQFPSGDDPTLTACQAFFQSVRDKHQPVASAEVGFGSAIACVVGKQAMTEGRTITVPQLPKS
ncbi:Gfo/Idh/MocA family oxidoreductase [Granulicella sp. dw_53]|uniref:Gfo/Idh/MocA family protein n=1 Tax=Granulicella sp. dw_53 TaxID=2719792 RepID=UPI001BD5122B|nr:Gfo/Idh/MocA family oxidoreductase [Granulicella sp. dw_53]